MNKEELTKEQLQIIKKYIRPCVDCKGVISITKEAFAQLGIELGYFKGIEKATILYFLQDYQEKLDTSFNKYKSSIQDFENFMYSILSIEDIYKLILLLNNAKEEDIKKEEEERIKKTILNREFSFTQWIHKDTSILDKVGISAGNFFMALQKINFINKVSDDIFKDKILVQMFLSINNFKGNIIAKSMQLLIYYLEAVRDNFKEIDTFLSEPTPTTLQSVIIPQQEETNKPFVLVTDMQIRAEQKKYLCEEMKKSKYFNATKEAWDNLLSYKGIEKATKENGLQIECTNFSDVASLLSALQYYEIIKMPKRGKNAQPYYQPIEQLNIFVNKDGAPLTDLKTKINKGKAKTELITGKKIDIKQCSENATQIYKIVAEMGNL